MSRFTGWAAFSVHGVEGEDGVIFLSAGGEIGACKVTSKMGRALLQLSAIQREAASPEGLSVSQDAIKTDWRARAAEDVARIIDEDAFYDISRLAPDYEWHRVQEARETAITKARSILAIFDARAEAAELRATTERKARETFEWSVAWMVRQARDEHLTDAEKVSVIAYFPSDLEAVEARFQEAAQAQHEADHRVIEGLRDGYRELSDAVFGCFAGDEPNVYADYDRLSELHGRSIALLEGGGVGGDEGKQGDTVSCADSGSALRGAPSDAAEVGEE